MVLTITVCPGDSVTLSVGEGEPEGDQVADEFQSPEAIEMRFVAEDESMRAHVKSSAAIIFRKTVCLVFMWVARV